MESIPLPKKGIDSLPYKVEVLDGGFCFEFSKKYANTRSKEAMEDTEYIKSIHKGYIDLKCDYVTTGNFNLRPSRGMENWKEFRRKIRKTVRENIWKNKKSD